MLELRWVLLGLGLLVILGVYLWGRIPFGSPESSGKDGPDKRAEPRIGEAVETSDEDASPVPYEAGPRAPTKGRPTFQGMEKVVTIRLVPRDKELKTDAAVLAMRKHGLEHGEYGIFHRLASESGIASTVFSVSNLTEPGSFDLSRLSESPLSGLSMFLVLPGDGDPVQRFDAMLETARSLARDLNAELYDEKGSSWSIQRERYLREEMIQYKHQLQHG